MNWTLVYSHNSFIWIPILDKTNTKFTEWTSWSECSRTCIKDYENLPYKRRSRTCHPYCKKHIGTEEEACVDLPMCNNGNT